MKQYIPFVVLIVLIAIGVLWYVTLENRTSQQELTPFDTSVAYLCANDKVLAAGFSDQQVTVVLDDSRVFTLEQVVSASGTRYANEDEAVVFYTKGSEAFLEENGIATYTGCSAELEGEQPGKEQDPQKPDLTGKDGCYIGGCSSQVCSDDPNVASTCEFLPEYACYQQAICERQTNGECGWTQTAELTACLDNPPALE